MFGRLAMGFAKTCSGGYPSTNAGAGAGLLRPPVPPEGAFDMRCDRPNERLLRSLTSVWAAAAASPSPTQHGAGQILATQPGSQPREVIPASQASQLRADVAVRLRTRTHRFSTRILGKTMRDAVSNKEGV